MKKQYGKDIKERFQLPGKLALALENLVGQKENFVGNFKNYLLTTITTVNNILNTCCLFGTTPTYALR